MKFIYRFFVVLGVIFFCLLLAVGYFIIADPYNLRPIIMSMYQTTAIENDTSVIPATSRNQTNGTESTESKPAITEQIGRAHV